MEFTGLFLLIALFTVAIAIYVLPTVVAKMNNRPNFKSIFLLNLLLGWSLIGWGVALIWAARKD